MWIPMDKHAHEVLVFKEPERFSWKIHVESVHYDVSFLFLRLAPSASKQLRDPQYPQWKSEGFHTIVMSGPDWT